MGIPCLAATRRGLRLVAGSAVVPTWRRGRLLSRLGVTGLDDPVLGHGVHRAGSGGHQRISGDGVWMGSGVTVLPGATTGSGCVIGAGTVVTADYDPDGLCVGVPARRRRDLEPGKDGTA